MPFERYNSIISLHKEEVDEILCWWCNITEKIDWSNTSIWMDEDGIHTGSRNQDITWGSFRGFNEYVNNHEWILRLLDEHPTWRLYGEWLVRHTIQYKEDAYQQWYMFDIMQDDGIPLPFKEVEQIAKEYWINTPHCFGEFHNPTIEQVKELAGKSILGEKWEWVVIRNMDFINKWWNRPYGKLVTETFKETNAMVFWGNNKHSESYWEMYVTNKYCTLARVKKIMNKINSSWDRECDERDTSQLCSRVLNDIITEEGWEIFNKVPEINNRKLKVLISKKAAQMFKDILRWFESVAYEWGKETEETEVGNNEGLTG